jgi:ABC-type lipoprotein export system ATPase subunit
VAIARALVNNPEVIFADEPTGNLDSKSGAQVMKILQELNKKGNTIILVTHEKSTAEHAERIIKIKDGNIIEDVKNFCRQEAKDELIK